MAAPTSARAAFLVPRAGDEQRAFAQRRPQDVRERLDRLLSGEATSPATP